MKGINRFFKSCNTANMKICSFIGLCYLLIYPLAVALLFKESGLTSFCFFVMLFMRLSDPGGVYHARMRMLLVTAILLMLGCSLAFLIGNNPMAALLMVFIWTLGSGLFNAMGARWWRISSVSTVSFLIIMLSPLVKPDMATNWMIIISGYGWIVLPLLCGYLINPNMPLYKATADYIRVTAPMDSFSSDMDNREIMKCRNNAFLMIRDLKGRYSSGVARMHKILKNIELANRVKVELSEALKNGIYDNAALAHCDSLLNKFKAVHFSLASMIESYDSQADRNKFSHDYQELVESLAEFKQQLMCCGDVICGPRKKN